MSGIAKLYLLAVTLGGAWVLAAQLSVFHSENPPLFLGYLISAIAAAPIRIPAPSGGALSLFPVYVFFGMLEFSQPETVLIGCVAAVVEAVFRRGVPSKPWRLLFTACNMALAVSISFATYHSVWLRGRAAEAPLLLTLAAFVFFGCNTFPAAAVSTLVSGESFRRSWNEAYFWAFPYYLCTALIAGGMSIVSGRVGWQSSLLLVPVLYIVYRMFLVLARGGSRERKHTQEMASLHLRAIEALALAIEAKDHTTHDHLRRVQIYSLEVARHMGLSPSETEALRAAALLHDIGKLAVPEHIVSKPGKLTYEEFEKMKIHPVVGAEILERVRFPYPVTPIVRSHHEKWNGTGYPDGLKGEEIPLGARILAAVDCLDALSSDRQYRRAVKLNEAMRYVSAESGVSFDPRVVQILESICGDLEKLAAAAAAEPARLSTAPEGALKSDGAKPAAGLLAGDVPEPEPAGFLASIASARQEVQVLFELAQDIGNSLSLTETLSLVAMRLKKMIPFDSLAIYVPKGEALRPEYVSGENFRQFSALEIPIGLGISGWVAQTRKPLLNADPAMEPGYNAADPRFVPMLSAVSVPLAGVDSLVSVLTLYGAAKDGFSNDHLRILLAIAPKVALAIENALKYQRAENSASTDYMTGLPNARSLFLHLDGEIARCRRTSTPLVVLVCDLNGFKQVNDQFGHLEGNRLLRHVAVAIKESCREYDYVARMGGDEFVLVLPGLSVEQVPATAARLKQLAKESGQAVCKVNTLGFSVGHAAFPEDGTDAEHLLSEADRRMYAVKQREKMKMVEPRGYDFDQIPTH